jgi:hypothetical protein
MARRLRRGEVWSVRFDPSVGSEIQKVRPAVVLSGDSIGRLPLRIVVPVTDWQPAFAAFPWFVLLPATSANGLTKDSGPMPSRSNPSRKPDSCNSWGRSTPYRPMRLLPPSPSASRRLEKVHANPEKIEMSSGFFLESTGVSVIFDKNRLQRHAGLCPQRADLVPSLRGFDLELGVHDIRPGRLPVAIEAGRMAV